MLPKVYKIGITGGIGSGKSLICKIFSVFGIPVYDADNRAKWLLNNDALLIESVKKHFGEEAYQNNTLNRDYIANLVFNNKEQLQLLNSLVHPQVALDYANWTELQSHKPYTLKEAALLIESGSYKKLDKVINVSAPVNLRIRRVMLRDAFRTEIEIKSIISKQLSDEERQSKADYTIKNDETTLVIPQVWKLHNKILQTIGQKSFPM